MTCYLVHDYLPALALTLATELPVAALLGFRTRDQFLAVLLLNLVTHPTIHYFILVAFLFGLASETAPLILTIEVVVFLAEWMMLVYALRLKLSTACVISLAMNLVSYLVGAVVLR